MDLKQKLPLFDLKLHNHHILLCGGGGDKMYGKMNGIILCDLKMTTLFFLKTDDLIEKIELCKIKKSSNKKSKRKVRKHKDVYEIIAIGTENYYIVRCKNQRLDIVYKKNVRIENVTLDTYLYFMLNDKLMKSDIYLENKEEVTDRNNFVKHKTVTFKQNVYDFEEDIHCPIFNKTTDEMVFFTKHNNKTNVVFLKDDKQVFNIDKVTCLSENDGVVTVGTCLGEVYVFDRKRKYKKIKAYELPITGCAYKNGWVYFSSFDGFYGRKWAFVYKKYYAIAIAIIVIFLAICVTHLKKSKD